MANANKKKIVQITVDFSKTIGSPDAKEVVLLFDEASNCYYRASLSHIIGAAVKAANDRADAMEKRFEELKKENEAFRKSQLETQNKFISDTKKINESIINLIEGGKK